MFSRANIPLVRPDSFEASAQFSSEEEKAVYFNKENWFQVQSAQDHQEI